MKSIATQYSARSAIPAVLALIIITLFSTTGAYANAEGIVTRNAKGSFENTIIGLEKAISANKLVIVKELPLTRMLNMVGVKAEKIKSLEIFHPRFGKAIYEADKNALLEAPLRILVREKSGGVIIQYRKPSVILAGYSGLSGLGGDLDKVFKKIVDSVAK